MAGILNNKQRIMDAIFTVEGRRQMANGTIRLSFASFTDEGLFYDSDDGTHIREIMDPGFLTLEAVSLPRDVIVPEVNDAGEFSLNASDNSKIVNGRRILSGSTGFVTGTLNMYSGSLSTIASAIQHFDWNQIIGTIDSAEGDISSFSCNKTTINLTTDTTSAHRKMHISKLRPVLFDRSLSHMRNVKYLPPQYEDNGKVYPLGNYPKITTGDHTTFDTFAVTELLASISKDSIQFVETSEANNLIGQCFEISENGVNKLLIVDYGEFRRAEEVLGRVFYLGKIIRDSTGTSKFVRLFTLVFR